jgi:hypothetical protein
MNTAKHILHYLKGIADYSIHYGAIEVLHGYTDSSYVTDLDDAKSFSGYGFFLHGGLIIWSTGKQNNVSLSSTESEFVGASNAIYEAIYLRQHIAEIEHTVNPPAIVIKYDNTGAITLATASVFHRKIKYIHVRYNHVRDEVAKDTISIEFIPTELQAADIFTKPLKATKYHRVVQLLRMTNDSKKNLV